jgi:hypothetical protein
MILPRYEEAFASLEAAEVHCLTEGLSRTRPELLELGDFEDGPTLMEWCRGAGVSQAEVIMSVCRDVRLPAISAVEKLCLKPIDRRSPREVELERHAVTVAARPTVAPVPSKTAAVDSRVIRLLVDKNPKRPGTGGHDRFAKYVDGMTVARFLEVGGTRDDLAWDQKRAFIRLDERS